MPTTETLSSRSSKSWDQNEQRLLSLWKPATQDLPKLSESPLSDEDLLEVVKAEIRKNHKFLLFTALPHISSEIKELKKMSGKLGIPEDLAVHFCQRLLRTGLWIIEDDRVVPQFEFIDLGDISVKEYLSMTVSIIAQLSEDKPGTYETFSISTTRPLIRSYINKVHQAQRELIEKSGAEPGKNCVFSWTHSGVIDLEIKNLIKEEDYI